MTVIKVLLFCWTYMKKSLLKYTRYVSRTACGLLEYPAGARLHVPITLHGFGKIYGS